MATQDTMNEGLRKILAQIAGFKVTPDADPQFLAALEGMIVDRLKQTASQAAGGGGPAMGGAMMGGGGPDMGMGQPNQMQPGGLAGGGMGGLTTPPNPDELRRVLAGNGAMG